MTAASDTLIGTVVDDRFEIRDKIGQGGMGAVYRAWQRSTEREIAVKLIAKQQLSEPMAVERFLREARLASQLSHPNTISIYDFGKLADGRLFIAMELVRGKSLGHVLKTEGALAFPRIVRVAIQICDALAAAHAQKIVHRDLKPDNVMLIDGTADLAKVLDFGLAKKTDDRSLKGTAAGIVVGTPRYIAPESMLSGASYPEGDLYALGVMIGEMALGRPLWRGDTLADLCKLQMKPAEHIREIPEPLHGIVASLVDPTPAMRPTATQLRERLVSLQSGAMPPSRPSQPPPAVMNTAPPTVPATPAALPDFAALTETDRPEPLPSTLRGTPGRIPETPATGVFLRKKSPTADAPPSPWARPQDDARPTERARPPSAAPPMRPSVSPSTDLPSPSPPLAKRRRWVPYAAAGAAVFVAGFTIALLARGESSSPAPSPQPTPTAPTASEPSRVDAPVAESAETTVDAAVETAAPDEPSGSGVFGAAATAVKKPTKPTTTKTTPTKTPKLKSPTECMAIRDQNQKWECLRAWCAQNPVDPLCDLEYEPPTKKSSTKTTTPANDTDGIVDPFGSKPAPKGTPAKTPAAKETAKTPVKRCDTCLERGD